MNNTTKFKIDETFTLCVDDTTILWHNKNETELQEVITNNLKKLCESNFLNISETNLVSAKSTMIFWETKL